MKIKISYILKDQNLSFNFPYINQLFSIKLIIIMKSLEEQIDSLTSITFPSKASDAKVGSYICIEGRPCKIVNLKIFKPGKYGHNKTVITGVDIFTQRIIETYYKNETVIQIPSIVRKEYSVISIDNNDICCLLDVETKEMNNDIKISYDTEDDCELSKKMKSFIKDGIRFNVFVLCSLNIEKIVGLKQNFD